MRIFHITFNNINKKKEIENEKNDHQEFYRNMPRHYGK